MRSRPGRRTRRPAQRHRTDQPHHHLRWQLLLVTLADGRRGLVTALAITQTIGYGALYYAFAVLLTPVAAGLHTSSTAVTGAFTASILTSALVAVPIGRRLDRHGGRALMTG